MAKYTRIHDEIQVELEPGDDPRAIVSDLLGPSADKDLLRAALFGIVYGGSRLPAAMFEGEHYGGYSGAWRRALEAPIAARPRTLTLAEHRAATVAAYEMDEGLAGFERLYTECPAHGVSLGYVATRRLWCEVAHCEHVVVPAVLAL